MDKRTQGPVETLETETGPIPWEGARRYAVTIEGDETLLVRRHLWANNPRAACEMIDPIRYQAAERWRLHPDGKGRRQVVVTATQIGASGEGTTHTRRFPR